jgi:hypothetical protein
MSSTSTNLTFADIQDVLDAILAKSTYAQNNPPISQHPPRPHLVFWRQTGNYAQDYDRFTTGPVPSVGLPIMNTAAGQELSSNFLVILTDPNGVEGIEQMPAGGPFITDAGYSTTVGGKNMTGQEIIDTIQSWLTNGFPQ